MSAGMLSKKKFWSHTTTNQNTTPISMQKKWILSWVTVSAILTKSCAKETNSLLSPSGAEKHHFLTAFHKFSACCCLLRHRCPNWSPWTIFACTAKPFWSCTLVVQILAWQRTLFESSRRVDSIIIPWWNNWYNRLLTWVEVCLTSFWLSLTKQIVVLLFRTNAYYSSIWKQESLVVILQKMC